MMKRGSQYGISWHLFFSMVMLALGNSLPVLAEQNSQIQAVSQPAVAATMADEEGSNRPTVAPEAASQLQSAPTMKPDTSAMKSAEQQSMLESMDDPRDYLSNKIIEFGKDVDHFFGDPRYFQENNKSVVQVEFNQTFDTGGNYQNRLEGKAKIDLPAAQRRFRLVLESNPAQNTQNEIRKDVTPLSKQPSNKPEQLSAALRYERPEQERFHYSAESGAELKFPLDPFIKTRGSYSIPFDEWHLKMAESVFWFSILGLGESTQLDLEHQLGPPVLFRSTSTATCYESPQICDLRQDLTIFHTLSDRAAIQYQVSVLGVNQPKLTETNYVLQSRYRYRVHKDWVFFEINPQISFPKTDSFHLNSILFLRLEVLLGATR